MRGHVNCNRVRVRCESMLESFFITDSRRAPSPRCSLPQGESVYLSTNNFGTRPSELLDGSASRVCSRSVLPRRPSACPSRLSPVPVEIHCRRPFPRRSQGTDVVVHQVLPVDTVLGQVLPRPLRETSRLQTGVGHRHSSDRRPT